GTLGTQFDRVWLSNSWWRILKADMADPSNGNQALILKEQALTKEETGDGNVKVMFEIIGEKFYFRNDPNLTGYSDSYLKTVIDSYYDISIAPTYSNYVLPVDLDLPNWTRYQTTGLQSTTSKPVDYNNWQWQDGQSYYKDNRFITSLTPLTFLKQQAFALSYGDIQSLNKSTFSATGDYSTLLDFTAIDANYPNFWLRSAGLYYSTAGSVYYGTFGRANGVHGLLPVRPALAIQLD
ncbi:hypothetical protein, partial [Pseudolactococcus chungangensis]|uniref:hypothetical protein n=1 Tax=Pseudolactococcus chungangensis TaxID=451457 RepID=UPI0028D19B72